MASLQASLANLALKCYADRLDYVDSVFGNCFQILTSLSVAKYAGVLRTVGDLTRCSAEQPKPVAKQILSLLQLPLSQYNDIQKTLELGNYLNMTTLLGPNAKKEFANIVDHQTLLVDHDKIVTLFGLLAPLIRRDDVIEGQEDAPNSPKDDPKDELFIDEQTLLARVIRQLHNDSPDLHYKVISMRSRWRLFNSRQILSTARKHFGSGGNIRMKYTLPPLIFQMLQLSRRYASQTDRVRCLAPPSLAHRLQDELWTKKVEKIFQFVRQTILGLVKAEYIDLVRLRAVLGRN